jgi:hypothetical protein
MTFALATTAANAATGYSVDADLKQVFTVNSYGTKGNGTTLDTVASRQAPEPALSTCGLLRSRKLIQLQV